jgi:chromosome segregation ATPase
VQPSTKHHDGSNKYPEGNIRDRTAGKSGKSTSKEQSTVIRLSTLDSHEHSEKSHRPKRSSSPPRKKSKYSAFSSEVDKALSVIHSELEKAGQVGKSEGHLRDKIKDLELRLRVKDNQILLGSRELAQSQKSLAAEHCQSERLQSENTQYKKEVMRLRAALETKDSELRDWRAKLRSMIGNDLG